MEDARWLLDGMNVLGSRPDGWWRDRDAAVRRLLDELEIFAAERDVTVVFDGRPVPGLEAGMHGPLRVRYARLADESIVDLVRGEPGPWRVVTSDRELRRRVTATGADVEGAGAFLRRLAGQGDQ